MPSWLTGKVIGALAAALILLALVGERARWMHRAHVAEAQEQADCQATRTAAGLPKLKCTEADEQISFIGQALNAVRTTTIAARAADKANVQRVEGNQTAISQERGSSYEKRIADARARSELVRRPATRPADSRSGGAAHLPGVPASTGQPAPGAAKDRLPADDALVATEQAIQLDELIKWVRAQHAVDVNGAQPKP